MQHLITPTGDLIAANPATLRPRLGAVVSQNALVAYAIRNMGYVGFAHDRDSATVRIAPNRTSVAAYRRLYHLLEGLPVRRVSLASFIGGWHYELLPGRDAIFARLSRMMLTARSDGGARRYIAEPRAVDALARHHPQRAVLEAWRETGGELSAVRTPHLFHDTLADRFVIITCAPEPGRLVFAEIGAGLEMYASGWHRVLVGQDIKDQPDIKYARAVAGDWRNDFLSGEPNLMDVDAQVWQRPGADEQRWRYSRLTVPIVTGDGTPALLSVSAPNPDIDFRSEVH